MFFQNVWKRIIGWLRPLPWIAEMPRVTSTNTIFVEVLDPLLVWGEWRAPTGVWGDPALMMQPTSWVQRSADDPTVFVGRVPALDGIRALAISLVLFFHGGFAWAGGGFFGVDIFFVLSGFLITGLLVAEFRRDDRVRLGRFWGHRVRRLLPALLALMVGVVLYAVFLAPPDTLSQLRGDAFATLLYGNNWHLISGGTGYFADLKSPRPLLHTWSLSIEEQFYLVWPLVVVLGTAYRGSLHSPDLGAGRGGRQCSDDGPALRWRGRREPVYYGTNAQGPGPPGRRGTRHSSGQDHSAARSTFPSGARS